MGGWATGVENAKLGDRGNFLEVGTHDVEVIFTRCFKIRGKTKIMCKARVKILASTVIRAGEERDICVNVDPANEDARGLQIADVRALIMATERVAQEEVKEETIYYLFPEGNDCLALKGKKMRVAAASIKIGKEKMQDFTKYRFSTFEEKEHEQLKQTRAA